VALALGAVPAFLALIWAPELLESTDLPVAGAALALALLLGWALRRGVPAVPHRVLLAAALAAAAAPTLTSAARLHGPITSDERSYLYQAELFAEGRLAEPLPPLKNAWHRRQVFEDEERGLRYSKYPPGTAAALVPGVALGWPHFSTLLAGLLDVLLVTAAARRLGFRSPGLAGLLLAISPFFLLVQTSFQSEVFALPAALAGYWALLRAREDSVSRRMTVACGALAGACCGFVFLGRPLTGLMLAAALGLGFLRGPRCWPALAGALAGGAPFAALALLYNAAQTGNSFTIPYHLYAVKYGPWYNEDHLPKDVYGNGDFWPGVLALSGRWSVAFAGMLGAVALGVWGLFRLRKHDGGAGLAFLAAGLVAYAFHWYPGHYGYLGPLYGFEALGFLTLGAIALLTNAAPPLRAGLLVAALLAGPTTFAVRWDILERESDLRSAPERAAAEAPPGAVILLVPVGNSRQDDPSLKYWSPSRPSQDPRQILLLRSPDTRQVGRLLEETGLAGRPVFVFRPEGRDGRLEAVPVY
jgi:hypothetical protein